MQAVYRGLSQQDLDAAYNSDAAVPDGHRSMQQLRQQSAIFRRENAALLDLSYGPHPRNKVDLFLCDDSAAATLVFFHGGNWRGGDKAFFAALATGPLSVGFPVAFVGYRLAPEARMADIVSDAKAAVRFVRSKLTDMNLGKNLIASGWSAGAQLAALCLDAPGVVGGLLVSGLYDLDPIRLCYLNVDVRLSADDVLRYSPLLNLPRQAKPLVRAVGEKETSELVRQTVSFAEALQAAAFPVALDILQGHDHFSLLTEWAVQGRLTALLKTTMTAGEL